MQKRKDSIIRQSPSAEQDRLPEQNRKEKPPGKQHGRERKKSETTGTEITTVIIIYKPLLGTR